MSHQPRKLTILQQILIYCRQGPGHFTPAQRGRLLKLAKQSRPTLMTEDVNRLHAWRLLSATPSTLGHAINGIIAEAQNEVAVLKENATRLELRNRQMRESGYIITDKRAVRE